MAVTSFTDGRGGFADSTITRAATAYRVPDDMSDIDAAAFRIGFSTAWIGLVRRGGLVAGEWLLVLGAAGGSGATAIQLGKALGNYRRKKLRGQWMDYPEDPQHPWEDLVDSLRGGLVQAFPEGRRATPILTNQNVSRLLY